MPTDSVSLSRPTDADIPTLVRIITLAFAGTTEGVTKWLTEHGLQHLRVLREGDVIPAMLRRVDMGQYFGGRRVGLMGIAGVGTAPEHRGRGYARQMMELIVREAFEQGVPLGGLYASTQALYRQSGYEQAGHRFLTKIPISRLEGIGKARRVVSLTEADHPRIEAVYKAFAALWPGALDRAPYGWQRIRKMWDSEYQGFGVLNEAGELGGYLYLSQSRDAATGRQELTLSDIAFTNVDHARALIGLLADFEPMANTVSLAGGPMHPLVTLLPQQRYEVKFKDYWMLRVINVAKAIESRGYSSAVRGGVTIDVRDDVVPANAGAWRVEIEGGRATVTRGTTGPARLACDIKGLAAIYSGLYTPRQAALLGLCEGDDAAFDLLAAAFAQGTPWMSDHF
ncbi:MAG: GNAT family N-acetyltransferase [Phycisphaerales bacterium]|nr:GNAT family N-acetyltransferase [Phycisphaerales bacterium]